MVRFRKALLFIFCLLIVGCSSSSDWRTASRQSAGIAPDSDMTQEAVLQVYGADAWGWRGLFAVHTWIAAKRKGEQFYTVYDVVGWRERSGQSVVGIKKDVPDRYWYGARPELLAEHRGPGVDMIIDAVDSAARKYPWANTYTVFPGPNSNTFVAWIAKEVPELELRMPLRAIGSSYVYF